MHRAGSIEDTNWKGKHAKRPKHADIVYTQVGPVDFVDELTVLTSVSPLCWIPWKYMYHMGAVDCRRRGVCFVKQQNLLLTLCMSTKTSVLSSCLLDKYIIKNRVWSSTIVVSFVVHVILWCIVFNYFREISLRAWLNSFSPSALHWAVSSLSQISCSSCSSLGWDFMHATGASAHFVRTIVSNPVLWNDIKAIQSECRDQWSVSRRDSHLSCRCVGLAFCFWLSVLIFRASSVRKCVLFLIQRL